MQFEETEIAMRKWLGDMPRTVVFDRLEFTVNAQRFQQRLNDNAPNWPILNNIPETELIVVYWRQNWHRAVYKCRNELNDFLQLVDSSVSLKHRSRNGRYLQKRRIMDREIVTAPWCRVKGYIFGVKYPNFPQTSVPKATQDIFDEFFGVQRTVIAVLVEIPQNWERLRYVYKCDFIADLGNGFQSLRSRMLNSGDNWTQVVLPNHKENRLQRLKVQEIIDRMNLARTGSASLHVPLRNELRNEKLEVAVQNELSNNTIDSMFVEKADLASAALPFKFTIQPDEEVLLHHLIWELDSDGGFQVGQRLGRGSFGEVFQGQNHITKELVAIKMIPFEGKISMNSYRVLQEINANRALNHENVIAFIKYFVAERLNSSRRNAVLVFELAREDLNEFIRRNVFHLDETHIASILFMLAKGLNHIHTNGYIHRDLKPKNIMISKDGIIKIADFGLTIRAHSCNYTGFGTRGYMAPEMLFESYEYNSTVDIWSYGCIATELAIGTPVFGAHQSYDRQLRNIFNILGSPSAEEWPEFAESYEGYENIEGRGLERSMFGSPELMELTERVLSLNPRNRPSAEEILSMDFFQRTKFLASIPYTV